MRAKIRGSSTLSVRRGRRRLIKTAREKTVLLSKLSPSRIGVPVESSPADAGSVSYDGDTAFHLYLREISRTPLLTPQEEIELARRIKRGDKKTREQMIKANHRLVVK